MVIPVMSVDAIGSVIVPVVSEIDIGHLIVSSPEKSQSEVITFCGGTVH
jgi:hypothetical protein